jgi:hypothetical protein
MQQVTKMARRVNAQLYLYIKLMQLRLDSVFQTNNLYEHCIILRPYLHYPLRNTTSATKHSSLRLDYTTPWWRGQQAVCVWHVKFPTFFLSRNLFRDNCNYEQSHCRHSVVSFKRSKYDRDQLSGVHCFLEKMECLYRVSVGSNKT